jgi:hypothetical protein
VEASDDRAMGQTRVVGHEAMEEAAEGESLGSPAVHRLPIQVAADGYSEQNPRHERHSKVWLRPKGE